MRVIETFDDFATRQNCPRIVTSEQASPRTGEPVSRVVWENGAVWAGDHGLDPPTDPRQLLGVRLEYVRARLAREVTEFNEYKGSCLQQASLHRRFPRSVPGISPEAPALLRAGQARIAKLRDQLAELEAQLAATPEVIERQHREQEQREMEQEQLNKVAAVVAEIQSINI